MPLTYTNARRFAYYVSHGADNHKDILHYAYVRYWRSTGENLLDAPKSTIIRCIRNENINTYKREHVFIWNGEASKRIWFSFEDEVDSPNYYPDIEMITKEQELIDNLKFNAIIAELKLRVNQRQTNKPPLPLDKVIDIMHESGAVIAEELGVSVDVARYYKAQVKKIAKSMREYQPHNPFNGNKVLVSKVVRRVTYDKNPEKYSEFKNDSDRGGDENEWYTLLVNDKNEGLLIREIEK